MTDFALEGFRVVLETTRSLPGISAVPFLHEAAAIALRILDIARDVRSRNQAFNDLASDACGLVYSIVVECQNMAKEGHEVPERVQIHIASLARNLSAIEKFARKKVERGALKKIILHSKDLEEITRYRRILRQSLDVFGIQANISIQQNLQRILDSIERQNREFQADREELEHAQRRAQEELASRLEILRMQQEDRKATLHEELETKFFKESESGDRKGQGESEGRSDDAEYNEKTPSSKRSSSPSNVADRHHTKGRRRRSHYQYPMGAFFETHLHPSSPAPFPGYWFPPCPIPMPIPHATHISGTNVSVGKANTYVTNYNSGNINNTVISNSMNSYSSKKKGQGLESDSSDYFSDFSDESDFE